MEEVSFSYLISTAQKAIINNHKLRFNLTKRKPARATSFNHTQKTIRKTSKIKKNTQTKKRINNKN